MSTTSLSHGFQLIRTMKHAVSNVFSVCYIPHQCMHLSLDASHLHMWKGGVKIQKYPIAKTREGSDYYKSKSSSYCPGLLGIHKIIFLEKKRLYVVATKQLQMRVLDVSFEEISFYSNDLPILSMICGGDNDIICGEIGGIRIYNMAGKGSFHQDPFHLEQRLYIPIEDEWVNCVFYDEMWNRILGSWGTNLKVFDFKNGHLLDNYYDIHEQTITCIAFYEPCEYLLTGGKDGTIKVWNARKLLMFDFHEHLNSITGLLLLETVCEAPRGSLPLLVSSSTDFTVRMWNFETGQSLYRLDTAEACLGIGFLKKNHFYIYGPSDIHIWNVNRYQHTFAFFRSKPLLMKRVEYNGKPARILAATEDGSIKLISPISGATLGTGFPSHKESGVRNVAYDMKNEKLYVLNTNDDLVWYDTLTNPFRIIKIEDLSSIAVILILLESSTLDRFNVACEGPLYKYQIGSDSNADSRILEGQKLYREFIIFCGTVSGFINYLSQATLLHRCK